MMVEFSNPAALWLLTLIAPLIVLYLLKRRRKDVVVPSLMLWKQALEDMRAHRPFQRLRSQLLLYLQILILTLITAILSGPHLVETAEPSRRWVLVLDASASMQARDENPDRFQVARAGLLETLNEASPADEVLLLAIGAEASVLQTFTTAHSAVRQKLAEAKAQDTTGNWSQLERVLEPLTKERPLPRVVIASDFAGFPDEMRNKIAFDSIRVGKTGDNVAITRAVAEPLLEDPDLQQFFYQVSNFSTAAQTVDLELLVDNLVVDAYSIQIGPYASLDRTAELNVLADAQIKLRVKPDDALTLDNEFVLLVAPAPKRRVSVQYENPFLRKALRALPSLELSDSAGIRIEHTALQNPAQPGIYFLTPGPDAVSGRIVQWNSSHPILRFVDAGLWAFTKMNVLDPPADAVTLMETSQGPVAFARQSDPNRTIVLGFVLENSNLYQLAGFPVFLQNALQWIENGQRIALPSLTGIAILKEGPFQVGTHSGYANFADAIESRILPGGKSGLSKSGTQQLARKRDVSLWFLILAAGIVILEWWAFHRRIEL